MIIQMYINRCCFAHYGFNCHKIFIHPTEILFFIPNIAVHFFLKSFELINIEFLLSLSNGFCHLGITADIYFLGIIGTAGKGRININKVNLNAPLFKISASGNAFATNNHIAVGIFSYGFLLFHLIQRHTTLECHRNIVGTLVFEYSVKVAEHSLSFHRLRYKRYIFNRHYA